MHVSNRLVNIYDVIKNRNSDQNTLKRVGLGRAEETESAPTVHFRVGVDLLQSSLQLLRLAFPNLKFVSVGTGKQTGFGFVFFGFVFFGFVSFRFVSSRKTPDGAPQGVERRPQRIDRVLVAHFSHPLDLARCSGYTTTRN